MKEDVVKRGVEELVYQGGAEHATDETIVERGVDELVYQGGAEHATDETIVKRRGSDRLF